MELIPDYCFDGFRLDVTEGRLTNANGLVHLTPKALAVLTHLVHEGGHLVPREALFAAHWAGQVVTDDALTRCVGEIRSALGDRATPHRFIRTEHRRGFRWIATTERSTAATASVGVLNPEATDPFVGRDDALQRACARLERCAHLAEPALVAISGEAGIGKSTFATQLLRWAQANGWRALVVRQGQRDQLPPCWLWIQLLRRLDLLPSNAADLRALLPGWAAPATRAADNEATDVDFLLHDAVVRRLQDTARHSPLLVVLEDLHDADADALGLLLHVVQSIANVPFALALTYRDVGAAASAWQQIAAELLRLPSTLLLPLGPLPVEDVETWLQHPRAAAAPMSDRAEQIRALTGGNPLLIAQLLVATRGDPARLETWIDQASLTNLLAARLGQHDATDIALLSYAALLGASFETSLMQELVGRLGFRTDLNLADQLERLRRERLLLADGNDRFRFAHGLIHTALQAHLDSSTKRAVHGHIAELLEARAQRGIEGVSNAQLAHHFRQSNRANHRDSGMRYLKLARDDALMQFAYAEADALTAGLLQDLPATSVETAEELMQWSLIKAHRGEPTRSRELAQRSLNVAARIDAPATYGRAAALVCDTSITYPRDPELLVLLDQALKRSGLPLSVQSRLLAQRSFEHFLRGHEPGQIIDAEAAVSSARQGEDASALEHALAALGNAYGQQQRMLEWRTVNEERLLTAQLRGDLPAEFLVRRHRVEYSLQVGDFNATNSELDRFATVAEQVATPSSRAALQRTRAGVALATGDIATAHQLIEDAHALGQRSRDPSASLALFVVQSAALLCLLGKADVALAKLRSIQSLTDRHSLFAAADIYLQSGTGDTQRAHLALERLAADAFATLTRDRSFAVAICHLAVVAEQLNHVAAAEALWPLLSRYAGRQVTIYSYYTCGCASSYLGRLATVLQRWDEADRLFTEAAALEGTANSKVWRTATLGAYARSLAARGTESGRQAKLTAEANALAKAHGFVVLP